MKKEFNSLQLAYPTFVCVSASQLLNGAQKAFFPSVHHSYPL